MGKWLKKGSIYVDDIADACIYFMNKKTRKSLINIGVGKDYTIKNLLKNFKCSYVKAKFRFDKNKPDGTPRKLLDISEAKSYGWKPSNSRAWTFKSI